MHPVVFVLFLCLPVLFVMFVVYQPAKLALEIGSTASAFFAEFNLDNDGTADFQEVVAFLQDVCDTEVDEEVLIGRWSECILRKLLSYAITELNLTLEKQLKEDPLNDRLSEHIFITALIKAPGLPLRKTEKCMRVALKDKSLQTGLAKDRRVKKQLQETRWKVVETECKALFRVIRRPPRTPDCKEAYYTLPLPEPLPKALDIEVSGGVGNGLVEEEELKSAVIFLKGLPTCKEVGCTTENCTQHIEPRNEEMMIEIKEASLFPYSCGSHFTFCKSYQSCVQVFANLVQYLGDKACSSAKLRNSASQTMPELHYPEFKRIFLGKAHAAMERGKCILALIPAEAMKISESTATLTSSVFKLCCFL